VPSADAPVGCSVNRRPAAAKGAVVVRLWLSEGIVEDNIRVITGRWQQLPNSQPQGGRLCRSLPPEKPWLVSKRGFEGLDGRFLCRHQPGAAATLGVAARRTLSALHHL